jgi:hypothetical protein
MSLLISLANAWTGGGSYNKVAAKNVPIVFRMQNAIMLVISPLV